MPAIKVRELAYGRLRSPDLDVQEEFLTNFGMVRVARTAAKTPKTAANSASVPPVRHAA